VASKFYMEYDDMLTFEVINSVLINGGGAGGVDNPQFILAVKYTHEVTLPLGGAVHMETGQFLYNTDPAPAPWTIARIGSVPRGVGFVAHGNVSTQGLMDVFREQERANELSNLDSLIPNLSDMLPELKSRLKHQIMSHQGMSGLNSSYADAGGNLMLGDVLKRAGSELLGNSSGLRPLRATRLQLGAYSDKDFAMMEYLRAQTPIEAFTSTFWLFENASVPVLQYFQNAVLAFGLRSDAPPLCYNTTPVPSHCLQRWPHVQVSTLTKVRDSEVCP